MLWFQPLSPPTPTAPAPFWAMVLPVEQVASCTLLQCLSVSTIQMWAECLLNPRFRVTLERTDLIYSFGSWENDWLSSYNPDCTRITTAKENKSSYSRLNDATCPLDPVTNGSCTDPFLEMNKSLPLTPLRTGGLGFTRSCAFALMHLRSWRRLLRWNNVQREDFSSLSVCSARKQFTAKRTRCCQCVPLWTESTA